MGRGRCNGEEAKLETPSHQRELESPGGSYLYSGKGLSISDQVLFQKNKLSYSLAKCVLMMGSSRAPPPGGLSGPAKRVERAQEG